ncbi:MAG: acyl-CoA dehydrogenase [Acidobacteriota bacterium]|nr:acyl-CoA dehydrogenase [Blastocatellia bacterium]MDW8240900.1 acyl-CoA dehydrogenase [Acidobacteriota bacterium]
MNLNYTPEEEQFRHHVRAWLNEHLPRDWQQLARAQSKRMDEWMAFLKRWQRQLYEAGLAGISWPKQYGGRGATMIEQLILIEEMARAQAPNMLNISIGIELVGPAIMHHGTEAQKQRYLPKILSAEEIWSQGFSEPAAGSDLASLQTRALVKDDSFVVNGQKVWMSWAEYSDYCILLVRTDPTAPKHKGISFLLVDMRSPGITIRPTKQITGEAEFSEVFFDDVVVPRENLVGGLNQGWNVAMTVLAHERGTSAIGYQVRLRTELDGLIRLTKQFERNGRPASQDPLLRQKLAQAYSEVEILKHNIYRAVTQIMRTGKPGPESSIIKLFWSEMDRRQKEIGMEMLGLYSQLVHESKGAIDDGWWPHAFLWSRAGTIYAGSSEIQRNIIAERVLGMPKG